MFVYGVIKVFVLSFSEVLWVENRDLGVKIFVFCFGLIELDFFKKVEFLEFVREGLEVKLIFV